MVRNKGKLNPILLPPSASFQAQLHCFTSDSYTSPSLKWCNQEWELQSIHNTLALLLLPPHTVPLFQGAVPPTGYSLSWTASAWVISMQYSPSGTEYSSVSPWWATAPNSCSSCQEPGPQAAHGVLHGLQCGYLFQQGPPWTAVWIPLFCGILHSLHGQSASPWSFPRAAPVPQPPPPPPPSLTLVSTGLILSFFLLIPLAADVQHWFLPFLKHTFTEKPPVWLMGSAVTHHGSVLKPGGTGCIWHRVATGLFSERPSLQSPSCQHLAK